MLEPPDESNSVQDLILGVVSACVWIYLLKLALDMLSAPSDASVLGGAVLVVMLICTLVAAIYRVIPGIRRRR